MNLACPEEGAKEILNTRKPEISSYLESPRRGEKDPKALDHLNTIVFSRGGTLPLSNHQFSVKRKEAGLKK